MVGNDKLDPKAVRDKIHQYFAGQKKELGKREREANGELEEGAEKRRKKRNARVWKVSASFLLICVVSVTYYRVQKTQARKKAWSLLGEPLKEQYKGGEKLLTRECMSPVMSDDEDNFGTMTPGFRNEAVNEYTFVDWRIHTERYFVMLQVAEFLKELDGITAANKKKKEKKTPCFGTDHDAVLPQKVLDSLPDWAK